MRFVRMLYEERSESKDIRTLMTIWILFSKAGTIAV